MPKGTVTKKKVEKQINTYQGTPLDLGSISKELTEKARRFVFWFAAPYSDAFLSKKNAAIAAGYASRSAASSGYKLCRNPKVIEEIEKLSKSFNAETIDVLYQRYINTLETRAFYDMADYVTGTIFKPIEKIAPENGYVSIKQLLTRRREKLWGIHSGTTR